MGVFSWHLHRGKRQSGHHGVTDIPPPTNKWNFISSDCHCCRHPTIGIGWVAADSLALGREVGEGDALLVDGTMELAEDGGGDVIHDLRATWGWGMGWRGGGKGLATLPTDKTF